MFFNVPKPDSEDLAQSKAKVRNFVNSLVDNIGAGPVDIVDVVHLGRKASNQLLTNDL